jgi:hypothetical protein
MNSFIPVISTCPAFGMLVAYAISTSEGFAATEQFKSDPDYVLVETWFEEIRGKKHQGDVGETADIPAQQFPELVGREAPAQTAGGPEAIERPNEP